MFPVRNADRIQSTPDDVIPNSRQVFHTPSSHQYDGVPLQIMTHAHTAHCVEKVRFAQANAAVEEKWVVCLGRVLGYGH